MKRIAFAAAALALLIAQKSTTPTYLETLEVRVTNLDVVVTDAHGRPVTGLTPGDFDVRESGVPQAVTNFAEYTKVSAVAEMPAGVASPPPARKVVFFADELSLAPAARKTLAGRVRAFVEEQLLPGDEAMVVTPNRDAKVALAFTRDKSAIVAQLATVLDADAHFRADTAINSERLYYEHLVRTAASTDERVRFARMYAERVNRRVTSTLRTLLGIVGSLSQTEGRKVVILIAPSLMDQPGREAFAYIETPWSPRSAATVDAFSSRDVFDTPMRKEYWFDARPMIEELAARASANGITIYAIQPDLSKAFSAPGADVQFSGKGATTYRTAAVSVFQRDILQSTESTMKTLATMTGGRYVVGDRRIESLLKEVASDTSSYYSLGYRTPDGSGETIRNIEVTVKGRPELVVRSRRQILRRSPEREMEEIVTATLIAPRGVNELGIEAEAGTPKRGLEGSSIDVAVKIPLRNLTFVPVAGDRYRAAFSVHYAVSDAAGYTAAARRDQALDVPGKEIDAVRERTYTYTSTLVVAPGKATIAVGVMDTQSRLAGFQRVVVEAR